MTYHKWIIPKYTQHNFLNDLELWTIDEPNHHEKIKLLIKSFNDKITVHNYSIQNNSTVDDINSQIDQLKNIERPTLKILFLPWSIKKDVRLDNKLNELGDSWIIITSIDNNNPEQFNSPSKDVAYQIGACNRLQFICKRFLSASVLKTVDYWFRGTSLNYIDNGTSGACALAALTMGVINHYHRCKTQKDLTFAIKHYEKQSIAQSPFSYNNYKTLIFDPSFNESKYKNTQLPIESVGTYDGEFHLNDRFNFINVNSTLRIEQTKVLSTVNQPMLLFSGGLDSTCTLQSLIDTNKSFSICFAKYYINDTLLNYRDYENAKKTLDQYNNNQFNLKEIHIDINTFFEHGHFWDYAIDYEIDSPQLSLYCYLLDLLVDDTNQTFIICNDPFYWRIIRKEVQLGAHWNQYYCFNRWAYVNNQNLISFPFSMNNRMLNNNYQLDMQVDSMKIQDKYERKQQYFRLAGYNIPSHIKEKLTGFEEIKKHYINKYYKELGANYYRMFDLLFRRPIERGY